MKHRSWMYQSTWPCAYNLTLLPNTLTVIDKAASFKRQTIIFYISKL